MLRQIMSKRKDLFFLLGLSTVLMTFGSMTSILFPIHVGVDQNCFFTIGKSVLDGDVLYRDIYDQKGPLLFFIHTLAALISNNTFYGVYVLQIINFAVILCYVGKISDLFLDSKYNKMISSIAGLVIVTAFCYSRGDNAEEFCMPFLVIGLYHMLTYLNSDREEVSYKIFFLHGFFASCILWIKFTLLGFYIGWALVIGITLLRRKSFWASCKAALIFLGGMIVGSIPYFLYFLANGAVGDFLYSYFYTNIFMYSSQVTATQKIMYFFTQDIMWNFVFTPLILWGMLYFLCSKKISMKREAKQGLLITVVLTYFFVFIGGTRYRYYLLIMGAFVVFGVIATVKLLERVFTVFYDIKKVTLPIYIALYAVILLSASNCITFLYKNKEDYVQVKFAKIINQVENPTLLNYNFLDGGFYLMADTPLPDTKYFCRQNIPRENFPEMYDEQEDIIRNAAVDFVIVRYGRKRPLEDFAECKELFSNYKQVCVEHEGIDDYYYALYQKLPISNM